jgi:ferrous iron transport protein A
LARWKANSISQVYVLKTVIIRLTRLLSMLTLDQVVPGSAVIVDTVGGARSFRRRLMELGLIPGIRVEVLRIAPFGDPIELAVRGCNLSIRAAEAQQVVVGRLPQEARASVPSAAALAAGGRELARSRPVSGLVKSTP